VTVTPGRDLDAPLVPIDPDAPRATRAGLWLFRGYLLLVTAIALLTVVVTLVLIFLV
jgi:hypothetical protein